MKLPRDVGGEQLAGLLGKYGYSMTRQTGSHMRLTTTYKGTQHHVTIPKHNPLTVGTLGGIISEVASYLDMDLGTLRTELFK